MTTSTPSSPRARGTDRPPPGLQAVATVLGAYKRVFVLGPAAPYLARPRPVRRTGFDLDLAVDAVVPEADDVVGLTLRAAAGAALPGWVPGSHLDLVLPSGRVRQYSLCGDPEERDAYRVAVRRLPDGGGGSREVHDVLRPGAAVRARGPRNAFRLVDAPAYLFVAGGIGITPILPMVQAAERRGIPWRLVYVGRSRASMPFLDVLAQRRGGDVVVHSDDEHGFADVAALLTRHRSGPGLGPGGAPPDVYVCGPPPLMDAVRQLTRAAAPGTPLFHERFSSPPVLDGTAFDVVLARSGRTVHVAADESALDAIRRAVPDVAYSCRQGFCRTCLCTVLDGAVDHRDGVLLAAERPAAMLPCVSRAAGPRLVLDL
ncbi:Carnitine monooxygenase reductase subunit [Paraconexibacter sp. AEG42_29]|uniref:Carnitine monooxygenase reductase subunit n=1 Tax=Paraconexibacter sp. AEG42_29 TaxID=2997339 RepID=A0AAU7AQS7_9ACTN